MNCLSSPKTTGNFDDLVVNVRKLTEKFVSSYGQKVQQDRRKFKKKILPEYTLGQLEKKFENTNMKEEVT